MVARLFLAVVALTVVAAAAPVDVNPKPIASDPSVRYDYDIVYVRAPRHGDDRQIQWADVFTPLRAEPGSDLMLLHPDGTEELLVRAGSDAIADPFVSFDGEWVYFSRFHNVLKGQATELLVSQSADIFKIHVKTRRVVQLTKQEFTPNTGVADMSLPEAGVFNLGPCPVPGGKVMFTSTRNGLVSTKDYHGFTTIRDYPGSPALQLFLMDDDGSNVEEVGHLNINGALHPTILKDGRVMFSSFESEGLRDVRMWAIWTIHPDGTFWEPFFSALGASGETARHFMTQLSDGSVVAEEYYFQENSGFGTYYKFPAQPKPHMAFFGSASKSDPRNTVTAKFGRNPFSPVGLEELTPFSHFSNSAAFHADPKDPSSPFMGKVTHPSGAPYGDLLTVWSPGPAYGLSNEVKLHGFAKPAIDSGIYLMKGGRVVIEPGQMLLVKNDPRYNEQWPRALVPYRRVHGVDEPVRFPPLANDGKASPALPEGSPYGIVGTSSLYKRETYPFGMVPEGTVTAVFSGAQSPFGGTDPYESLGGLAWGGVTGNFYVQGGDAGKYSNDDIHAIRVLITEPTTDPKYAGRASRRWWNIADERLRILGEFPVRKFTNGVQPVDPDGNPDTSFAVKLPADVAWTFQTLDKRGMVLNMSQTWHQLRPGEVRTDCGGCHSHSQLPTPFEKTAAAKPDYPVFDLTKSTPLLTSRANDRSGKQWDVKNETGVRFENGVKNVEYFRDVKPILDRSCTACHTKTWKSPAASLVLDDDDLMEADDNLVSLLAMPPPAKVPGTFLRLALDRHGKFGRTSNLGFKNDPNAWAPPQGSRYIRYFQSRRSLLVWKIYGERLDGFRNEDFAYETVPGDPSSLVYQGKPYTRPDTPAGNNRLVNLAYLGEQMPPPAAVAGTYRGPDGRVIKVPALTDEDRRTIVRWIDLGCPIDFDAQAVKRRERGQGWLEDDNRPTLTLALPASGANQPIARLLVGMHDFDSGLDLDSFSVTADFPVDGAAPGENLASRFKPTTQGVRELKLSKPITALPHGTLTVSVKDRQGNLSRIVRQFSVTGGAY